MTHFQLHYHHPFLKKKGQNTCMSSELNVTKQQKVQLNEIVTKNSETLYETLQNAKHEIRIV